MWILMCEKTHMGKADGIDIVGKFSDIVRARRLRKTLEREYSRNGDRDYYHYTIIHLPLMDEVAEEYREFDTNKEKL